MGNFYQPHSIFENPSNGHKPSNSQIIKQKHMMQNNGGGLSNFLQKKHDRLITESDEWEQANKNTFAEPKLVS